MRAVWSVNHGRGGELLVDANTGRIIGAAYPRACGDGWIAEAEGAYLEGYFTSLDGAKQAAVDNLPTTYQSFQVTTP